jgi:hypothetical protein
MRDVLKYRVGEEVWHAGRADGLAVQSEYDLVPRDPVGCN